MALEGSVNFRDLGGYETVDGATTRWRVLFRADGLGRLTEADVDTLRTLELRTVIDLRSDFEVDQGRFPVEEIPVDFHHLPFIKEMPKAEEFTMAPGMLGSSYLTMVDESAPQIGQALQLMADRRAQALVFHCTAGKDRTGVLAAVLLALLGVPEATITADYALSGQAMARLKEKLIERYPEGADVINNAGELFTAAPDNMTRLFASLRREHGSVEAYAASVGVGPDVVAALREALLQ